MGVSILIPTRSPYVASDRFLFFSETPVALYRAKIVPGSRKSLRPKGEPQAGGAGRSVFGNRRPAAIEASSGAAALSPGRPAALARQAGPDISSSAGELAL